MFKDRATFDIVVILLTMTVGGVLLTSVLGVFLLKMYHPQYDTSRAAEMVGGMIQTIVGALVGFIGGRSVGKLEEVRKNGMKTNE